MWPKFQDTQGHRRVLSPLARVLTMESVFDLFKMLMGECRWDLQGDDPSWPLFDPGRQVDRQLGLIKNLGRHRFRQPVRLAGD
jgi:hypothetical protein